MALLKIDSAQALENAKNNPNNAWPKRGTVGNRVEPFCKPAFSPSFRLVPNENVFTIGSCFARNVEAELERLGFVVPMRHVQVVTGEVDLNDPENNPNIFNNYSAPSILNELEWALDPSKPFEPAKCLVEVSSGSYCDLHLSRFLKAVPLDEAIARRARIKSSMASIKNCRVVIITLGLVEAWFDRKAGRYLNIAPPRQTAKREPERFELHVLSHDDVIDHLERIVALLRTYGHPEHRIILTVSPVPLGLTHTDQDVIVANGYSKAVLRAAAQQLFYKYEHVDYYPSYESVMTSDRGLAWHDDLRHVTAEVVAINVNRMVDAYCGGANTEALINEAQSHEKAGRFQDAAKLYQTAYEVHPYAVEVQLALGRCKGKSGEHEVAVEFLRPLISIEKTRPEAVLALSQTYRLAQDAEGYTSIVRFLEEMDDAVAYRELVVGSFAFGRTSDVLKYADKLEEKFPRSPVPGEYRGRLALAENRVADAEKHFMRSLSFSQSNPAVFALYGQTQAALGKIAEAGDSYKRALEINPRTNLAITGLAELGVRAGQH